MQETPTRTNNSQYIFKELSDGFGAAGAAMMIGPAAVHIVEGEGGVKDSLSLGLGLVGVASMATGVGEVGEGVVTIGWEIWELSHAKE